MTTKQFTLAVVALFIMCHYMSGQKNDATSTSQPTAKSATANKRVATNNTQHGTTSTGKYQNANATSTHTSTARTTSGNVKTTGSNAAHKQTSAATKETTDAPNKVRTDADDEAMKTSVNTHESIATKYPEQYRYHVFTKPNRIDGFTRKHCRAARHCGCAGDITFTNTTDATIKLNLSYLTMEQLPTVPNAAMPSVTNRYNIAFKILCPGESTVFRGSCEGGIAYEAVSDGTTDLIATMKRGRIFRSTGYFKMSCVDRLIYIKEESVSE